MSKRPFAQLYLMRMACVRVRGNNGLERAVTLHSKPATACHNAVKLDDAREIVLSQAEQRHGTHPIARDTNNAAGAPTSFIAAELTRRKALALLGVAGAATLSGCGLVLNTSGSTGAATGDTTGSSGALDCVVTPQETEGPYFVDEKLNRSDIRIDPSDGTMQEGVPLRLKISVSSVSGGACGPLAGAAVDVWHCNTRGVYSDVSANRTVGKKFLRGYQTTDANGAVEFTTVYPGWYSGRAVHIHFKVRMGTREFTSQLFFDEAVTAQVFSRSPYQSRGLPDTSNARDGIYRSATLLALSPDGDGYAGSFHVGIQA